MFGGTNGLDLVNRLKSLARNGQTIDVAQLQFVGLDQVHAVYGDRWRVEHDRIKDVAHAFLCKRIQPEDVLIPCDNGFVIVLGAVDAASAALTAHAMGESLNQFLLKEETAEYFKVDVAHESLTAQDLSELVNRLCLAGAENGRVREVQPEPVIDSARFGLQFQPVWDVRHEAVTTYYAEAVDPRSGQRISGYQFEDAALVASNMLEIDEATLRASEIAMRSMFERGKKAIIGVSIHVSSLLKLENRMRIFNVIAQLDPGLCKYRTVRLSGVVASLPKLYMKETVGFLSAHVPNVVVSMNAAEVDFSIALDCDASGLSCVVPPGVRLAENPKFYAKVRVDAAAARAHLKRFVVEGRFTAGQAHQCSQCGIDALASPTVWPPGKAPNGVFRWAASRFLSEANTR